MIPTPPLFFDIFPCFINGEGILIMKKVFILKTPRLFCLQTSGFCRFSEMGNGANLLWVWAWFYIERATQIHSHRLCESKTSMLQEHRFHCLTALILRHVLTINQHRWPCHHGPSGGACHSTQKPFKSLATPAYRSLTLFSDLYSKNGQTRWVIWGGSTFDFLQWKYYSNLQTTLVLSGDIANCCLKLFLTQADHKYLLNLVFSFTSKHRYLWLTRLDPILLDVSGFNY